MEAGWRFDPRSAVLRHPVQGNSLYPHNNDVTAWQEGEWCYVLTGTRDQRHGGDTQHLFRSRNPLAQDAGSGDTATWEYVHRFYRSERQWTDAKDDCACPEFFRIGSGEAAQWMLLHFCHNPPGGSRYYLGSYRDRRFHPESFDRVNWPGGNLHAPRAMLDGRGRRIMFANLNERRPVDELVAAGWSGCMSLPVALTLGPDGKRVRFAPVDEVADAAAPAARAGRRRARRRGCGRRGCGRRRCGRRGCGHCRGRSRGGGWRFPRRAATPWRSSWSSRPAAPACAASRCAVRRTAPKRPPWRSTSRSMRSGSSSARRVCATIFPSRGGTRTSSGRVQSAPLQFDPAQPVTLRVFVDHSVLEVFAGAGSGVQQFERYLTQRIYPTRPDALEVKLFSRGGRAVARRVRMWRMRSI